jgi:hypothetical protein
METENPTLALSAWPAPAGSQRAYHAMIKPIGCICNLDCTYCYYLHKKDLLGSKLNKLTVNLKPTGLSADDQKNSTKRTSAITRPAND